MSGPGNTTYPIISLVKPKIVPGRTVKRSAPTVIKAPYPIMNSRIHLIKLISVFTRPGIMDLNIIVAPAFNPVDSVDKVALNGAVRRYWKRWLGHYL